MKLSNEHVLVRVVSIGLLFFAVVLFYFNITVNNNKLNIFNSIGSSVASLDFYRSFGFVMVGNLLPYFAFKRSTREHLFVFILGSICAAAIWFFHPASWNFAFWSVTYLYLCLIGYALASMLVVLANKPDGLDAQVARQKMIDFYIFSNLLQFSLFTFLDLTTLLHPFTFDAVAYRIDATLGFLPSVAVAKLYQQYAWLSTLLDLTYLWAPLAFAILFVLQLRQKNAPPANILLVWAIVTVACFIAYQVCPISGPIYLFGKEVFPHAMPETEVISYFSTLAPAAFRNGMPSMHFGACLLFLFAARYQKSAALNTMLYVIAGLMVLATLGKGEHYLIDLIVSFPFIVAIQSYCTRVSEAGEPFRRQAIFMGVFLWLLWVVLVRNGFPLFYFIPGFTWIVSIITIGLSLYAYRRIWPYEVWGYVESPTAWFNLKNGLGDSAAPDNESAMASFSFNLSPASGREERNESLRNIDVNEMRWSEHSLTIPALFFVSGFTGLMYEVIFSKELALVFGGMATATFTVLAVYMGGMAIGAWLGGILIHRSTKSGLVLYALCELIIGVYCLATPVLFSVVKELYVVAAAGSSPDAHGLTVLRVVCGGIVLLIPTILMGATLPVMVAELQRKNWGVGSSVARLYGANTLGAAFGALLSGYFILPLLGVFKSTALSAVGSLLVAFVALKLSKSTAPHTMNVLKSSKSSVHNASSNGVTVGLLALFLTGCVTMLMEVNYMQLLAVVAGNSVYAFSLMLFSLLTGLGVGAVLAHVVLKKGMPAELALSLLLFILAGVLLYDIFQWDKLPKLFAAYGDYAYPLTFAARETVRAYVCWTMMFPPAVIIGACYPIALEMVTAYRGQFSNKILLGSAIGINTLGNIVGVLIGGFMLLPLFGTLKSVWIAAGICILAGLAMTSVNRCYRDTKVYLAGFFALSMLVLQPNSFDFTRLASGSNVYFQSRDNGEVIDHSESLDGGLTTVAVKNSLELGELKTLLTNGKFQGNNALNGEMKAQVGFAVVPLLHTTHRDEALVIGYGTGVSSRILKESGFRQLDIVDLSRDLVMLANKHFATVNNRVSEQPGVNLYATDGRNFLLLQNRQYDLISMEITSIWFAGAASLYNKEFYALAKKNLKDRGVLQQWIQLHHLTPIDLATILSSVHAVFPYVSLYELGGQGVIVASNQEQPLSGSAIQLMKQQSRLMDLLQQIGMSPDDIEKSLILSPEDVNRMMKIFSSSSDFRISTDDNLFLEYSTPKGNALDALKSSNELRQFLTQFSTKLSLKQG